MNHRTAPDPATLEIIRNRLLAAAEDMRVTLIRSAYTPTIYESEDCAIGLLDRNAEVIALSTGLPLFLGNLGQAVADSVELRGGAVTMRTGDVFLLNDSYLQGTHMQDCTAFAPVFWESELIGYAVARAHMVDLGSIEPGGGMASTTIYHEGLRLGPVRIFDADGPCHDMLDVRLSERVCRGCKRSLNDGESRCLDAPVTRSSPTAIARHDNRSGRFPMVSTQPRATSTMTGSTSVNWSPSR